MFYWLLIKRITDFSLGLFGYGDRVFLFGEGACVLADEILEIFLYIDGATPL